MSRAVFCLLAFCAVAAFAAYVQTALPASTDCPDEYPRLIRSIVALCCVLCVDSESGATGRAVLLVHKKLIGERVFLPASQFQLDERQKEMGVELFANGHNFTVEVNVYNVGDAAAYDVSVEDSWPEAQFTVLSGVKSAKYDTIAAYVTHLTSPHTHTHHRTIRSSSTHNLA